MKEKFLALDRIKHILEKEKSLGKKIVHCHGVFDLFHPGHLRHLQQAKLHGDILIVSLTPDVFVNKGPHRPYFKEEMRREFLASLHIVDYVVLNDEKDAISLIEKIQPDFYVKGKEYEDHEKDITGKIKEEVIATEKNSGKVIYTEGITFSSSSMINQFFTPYTTAQKYLIEKIKKTYSPAEILEKIDSLFSLRIGLLADSYLQVDYFLEPRPCAGQAYIAVKEIKTHQGAFFLEEILSSFANVYSPSIPKELWPVKNRFFTNKDKQCLYETDQSLYRKEALESVYEEITHNLSSADPVLIYDFQMGLIQDDFLTIFKDRSYSLVTEHRHLERCMGCKADLLDQQSTPPFGFIRNSSVKEDIVVKLLENTEVILTCNENIQKIPAFENTLHMKTFFPLFTLCIKRGISLELSGFLAVIYSSMGCEKVSSKVEFIKYLVHLLK